MAERTAIINGNPVKYDDCNSNQVYAVIKQAFPNSDAKSWTQEMIFPYLATGSDAEHCLRTLRRAEENLNSPKPKPKRRSRRGPGKAPRGHDPIGQRAKELATDALFNK